MGASHKTPEYVQGMTVIQKRLTATREFIARTLPAHPLLEDTFERHVAPLVAKGIENSVIKPEEIPGELKSGGGHREYLLSTDLILWHIFQDANGVPFPLLTHPLTGEYDGGYLKMFHAAHTLFGELRKLDQAPGFDRGGYISLIAKPEETLEEFKRLKPDEKNRVVMAVLSTRSLDHSTFVEETVFPLVVGAGIGASLDIPGAEEWAAMKANLASSTLLFYANCADFLGYTGLVRDMKDFAVRKLYPGIWEYTSHELKTRLVTQIGTSSSLMAEIKREIEASLRKEKIQAEVQLRADGKSFGSAGLKMKKRFEDGIVKALEKEGVPRNSIYVDAYDPRKQSASEGTGVTLTIDGKPASVTLVGNHLEIKLPETSGNRAVQYPINPKDPYIFPRIDDCTDDFAAHDLAACRIIIDAVDGNSAENKLIKTAREVTERIVMPAIARILQKHGINRFTREVEDFIRRQKANGYQSIHVDTTEKTDEEPRIAPFEWVVRTREMHEYAERGGAAHAAYKEGGGDVGHRVTDVLMQLLEAIPRFSRKKPEDALVRDKKTYDFTVRMAGHKDKKIQVIEGTNVIDALAEAGVDLSTVARITNGPGQAVKLLSPVESAMELRILTAGPHDKRLINPGMARGFVRHVCSPRTIDQLKRIIGNNDRNGNGRNGRR